MYSFFIFHLLFDSICYCLSMRLIFIFHVQKKTGSLLLNLHKTSTLSVVHTTLPVVYTIYSVSCKHCTHHKVSCVHHKSVSCKHLLCRSVVFIIYSVSCKRVISYFSKTCFPSWCKILQSKRLKIIASIFVWRLRLRKTRLTLSL